MNISAKCKTIVIDTNMVLDCFVFNEPAVARLSAEICNERLRWISTSAMRDEFIRVLSYPRIKRWVDHHPSYVTVPYSLQIEYWVHTFDQYTITLDGAPVAGIMCPDPDDQMYIDLAVAHQAVLLSKDAHLLRLKSKLQQVGVQVSANEGVIFSV